MSPSGSHDDIPPTPPPAKQNAFARRSWLYLTEGYRSERVLVSSLTRVTPAVDDQDLGAQSDATDLTLKRWISVKAIRWLRLQLLLTNVVFVIYAWAGRHWDVPAAAIDAWLGGTVIQVVGIVFIISRYLFPESGSRLSNGSVEKPRRSRITASGRRRSK